MRRSFVILAALPVAVAALGGMWSCFGGRRKKKGKVRAGGASGDKDSGGMGDKEVGARLANEGPALFVSKQDLPGEISSNAFMCAIGGRKRDLTYKWDPDAQTLYYAFGPDGYQNQERNAINPEHTAQSAQVPVGEILAAYANWAVGPDPPDGAEPAAGPQPPATREPAVFFLTGMLEMSNPTQGVTMTTYLGRATDAKAHVLAVAGLGGRGPKTPLSQYKPETGDVGHVRLQLQGAGENDGTLVAFAEKPEEGLGVLRLEELFDLCNEDNDANKRAVLKQFYGDFPEILVIALPDLKRMEKAVKVRRESTV